MDIHNKRKRICTDRWTHYCYFQPPECTGFDKYMSLYFLVNNASIFNYFPLMSIQIEIQFAFSYTEKQKCFINVIILKYIKLNEICVQSSDKNKNFEENKLKSFTSGYLLRLWNKLFWIEHQKIKLTVHQLNNYLPFHCKFCLNCGRTTNFQTLW